MQTNWRELDQIPWLVLDLMGALGKALIQQYRTGVGKLRDLT